jgi:hypothetical protein
MRNIKGALLVISLLLFASPGTASAQWGDLLQMGLDAMAEPEDSNVQSATDPETGEAYSQEEMLRQKQLGVELAQKEKKALFELQKSIFILDKMTGIGNDLITAQLESSYGVFTNGEKFNELIVSMSNLSEVLKDESQVVHDNKLFLKAQVDNIEKNSERMRSQLRQAKKESEDVIGIVNAKSSKVPQLLVDKFYPAFRNNAKNVNIKLKSSIETINEMMNATTFQSVTSGVKVALEGLETANSISDLGNTNDPAAILSAVMNIASSANSILNETSDTASLLDNFSTTMDEFNQYKGSIEEMSVDLLGYIDASKQLHEEGLVLLEEAHKTKTEEARLKQALSNVPDQEEIQNPFEDGDIEIAALDNLGDSMDKVWDMPLDAVPDSEGNVAQNYKEVVEEKVVTETKAPSSAPTSNLFSEYD